MNIYHRYSQSVEVAIFLQKYVFERHNYQHRLRLYCICVEIERGRHGYYWCNFDVPMRFQCDIHVCWAAELTCGGCPNLCFFKKNEKYHSLAETQQWELIIVVMTVQSPLQCITLFWLIFLQKTTRMSQLTWITYSCWTNCAISTALGSFYTFITNCAELLIKTAF